MAAYSIAAGAVFETVELFEHVFSYSTFRDLMQARRVCRDWKAIIHNSKLLKQTLFLEAAPVKEYLVWEEVGTHEVRRRISAVKSDYRCDAEVVSSFYAILALNPILESAFNVKDQMLGNVVRGKFRASELIRVAPGVGQAMFFTQPPTFKLYVEQQLTGQAAPVITWARTILEEGGIRIGHVVEAVQALLDEAQRVGLRGEELYIRVEEHCALHDSYQVVRARALGSYTPVTHLAQATTPARSAAEEGPT